MRRLVVLALAAVVGWAFIRDLRADRRVPDARAHTYVLEREQRVEAPLAEVAAFFEEPRNLQALTPSWMGFAITRLDDGPMRDGSVIGYTIRQYGVPVPWESEILDYEPGVSFSDLQTVGPYRYWRHRHTFAPDGDATLVRDRVEYQLPFGVLGRLAHAFAIERQLRRIFDYRAQAIAQTFDSRRA